MAGTATISAMLGKTARAPARGGSRCVNRLASFGAVGVLALALLLGEGRAAQAAAQAEVTAAVADGFARLVFTLPTDVEAEVRNANGIIIVAFKQPLDIATEHLALSAPGYIGVARRDPDGMAVRMALSRKVKINTMTAGEKLFVDLLPEGWTGLPPGLPQAVVDELARRARDAEKLAREQQQRLQKGSKAKATATIRVRVATLPTFTRYVFELPELIEISTDRNRDRLNLVFGAPLKFDLADARAALPASVGGVDAEGGSESTTVRYTFTGKVDVRTFREDMTFIVDVGAAGAGAAAPFATGPAIEVAENRPQPSTAEPQRPPQGSQPATPPAEQGAAAASSAPPSSPAPAASGPQTAQTPTPARDGTPATDERAAPGTAANAPVSALLKRQGDTVRLIFPFSAQTAAAVFRRGDTLWLVFDTTAPLDVARLKTDPGKSIRDVSVTPSGEGQVVRIALDRARLSSMAADDQSWIVSLGDTILEPTAPLSIARARTGTGRVMALVPFDSPQRIHRINDSGGDPLIVVTAYAPARGLLKAQEFVEFRALASTHGVAIEPLADDVSVELAPERIVVSRPTGLALTPGAATADAPTLSTYRPVALDAQVWGFDRQANFGERQASLMHAAASAPDGKRTAARLDVARFFLARDMFAEAKGVLDLTLANEREPSDLSVGLVLRSIANLMLGREDLALQDLATPVVNNLHDAPLWRGVVLSRLGRYTEAREGFKNLDAASAELPIELHRFALQEAARCALEVGDLAEAARRLNELESVGVPFEMRPAVSLLAGRLAEQLNRTDDALAAYRAAAESGNQPIAMQARLRTVALRHTLGLIHRDEEIAELETLTAAWRGDETEVEAMQLLTRAYSDDGRYRDAFRIMRTALAVHPRAPATRRMQDDAAAIFDGIFMGDRGDKLTPVEALGLFYDFRNLTPAGRRGDEMIRRLVERLIAMDLLTQAGELLQHQIDHRLQGAARAQVAVRLATIYLMNRKPDRALNALRATRMGDLPNELRHQRLLLEARALSESGRHDLAFEIIEGMEGQEVVRLRADIRWAARRWRESAEEIERLHGERWREATPLDAVERADILRAAIGYALAGDFIGLDRLREKYAVKMAEGPDRRMFDVVTSPLEARTAEFAAIAKASSSVDTLTAFLRDLRARYPDPGSAVSSSPQPGRV
jgi:tetratricopeptide (TPR) repeat protein